MNWNEAMYEKNKSLFTWICTKNYFWVLKVQRIGKKKHNQINTAKNIRFYCRLFSALVYCLYCNIFYSIFMMIIARGVRNDVYVYKYTQWKLTTYTQILNIIFIFTFWFSVSVRCGIRIIYRKVKMNFLFFLNRNLQFLKVNVKENDNNTTVVLC